MATYLITGGSGFIGSNIAEKLVSNGEKVRILDNFSTGRIENLKSIKDDVEIIEGDIRSLLTVEKSVKGIDYILHQAALPSVPRSISDPGTTNEVNISGTLNILSAAKDLKVKRVVIASSSSIYGDTEILPKKEDMIPNPLSPYAVSKLATEYYAKVFYKLYNLSVVVLRYFNVFGQNQNPDSQYSAVIPKFCKAILKNDRPIIFGDGTQTRDFTHVSNVVNANLLACQSKEAVGQIFNIACGSQITLNELFKQLVDYYKIDIKPLYHTERKGDIKHSYADITKAKKILGYEVKTSFNEGIRITAEYFRTLYKKD